jgi:hypothetical protein
VTKKRLTPMAPDYVNLMARSHRLKLVSLTASGGIGVFEMFDEQLLAMTLGFRSL